MKFFIHIYDWLASRGAFHTPAILLAALFALLLASCSTTSHLPEGEQLYIGIADIDYNNSSAAKKSKKAAKKAAAPDSVGVITSIGDAVKAVNAVLEGRGAGNLEALAQFAADSLSKEERARLKAAAERQAKDFETAKEEVDAVLAYPPNNALFGSSSLRSPLQIGLWVHNGFAEKKSKFGKWVYRTFGTEPVLISTVSPEVRTKVATNTLHNYGFFRGKVGYEVITSPKNPKKARIAYKVNSGPLSRLGTVAYVGFPHGMDSLLRASSRASLLREGDAFSVVNLSAEKTRLEKLFRENGYYFFTGSYTTYLADTLMQPGRVQLRMRPTALPGKVSHPWYIGKTTVSVRRNDSETLDKHIRRRSNNYIYGGDKMPLRPGLWRRSISHRRGELYSLSDENATLEKLGALGVLSQVSVDYIPRDTLPTCETLDVVVTATLDKLYESTFEMNATLKSNQQIGPGISYELAKRNAFRGAEKVSWKIFGSYEWQTGAGAKGGNSLLNSYELGTQLAFDFPRLMLPGNSRLRRKIANTVFAIDADWKNRSNFFNMVSMGISATYKWHKKATLKHELTLFDFSFDKLLHTTAAFDSVMTANPALYMSMRDQFVPTFGYNLTYASAASHRNVTWVQVAGKEGGNLISGIYAAFGKPFERQNKELFGNPFAQFLKFTAEVHHTIRINRDVKLATRAFGGVIFSYGNALRAPYSEQFYVGGANSVRAFTVRSIGPGNFRAADSKYAYMDQTGDVKLEANVELRARLFGSLHGAVFLDAGNVWLTRDDPNRPGGKFNAKNLGKLAVGTGAGLRYDLDFIVIRFDVGIGLHAPYDTGKSGWYNIPRFKDGVGLHLAIGYPF
ncbi:MAG: BamA/TamA family outer membrane protein [Bacteroidales bacterium]|nr:BamA/TamA family outer membrane protein [Bacteroidales bacterium]